MTIIAEFLPAVKHYTRSSPSGLPRICPRGERLTPGQSFTPLAPDCPEFDDFNKINFTNGKFLLNLR